jgi:TFIIF-interacting CTD phosphatase-like protein
MLYDNKLDDDLNTEFDKLDDEFDKFTEFDINEFVESTIHVKSNTYKYTGHKKLLILDLDNTLIYTADKCQDGAHDILIIDDHKFYVKKRPYLIQFIEYIFDNFTVAIWSAGNRIYVEPIVDFIFGDYKQFIHFIYSKEDCIRELYNEREIFLKPIDNILSYEPFEIIILDDNDQTFIKNINNAIKISAWYGNENDTKLLECINILTPISKTDNVMSIIEKNQYFKGF